MLHQRSGTVRTQEGEEALLDAAKKVDRASGDVEVVVASSHADPRFIEPNSHKRVKWQGLILMLQIMPRLATCLH